MQWSKLKTRAKSFIVPPLRKRIDFHVSSYRQSHDEAEKAPAASRTPPLA
jgi:hypothetical protein